MLRLHYLEEYEVDPRYCYVEAYTPCEFQTGHSVQPILARLGLRGLDLPIDEDGGGLELGDYVGNSSGMLVLRRRLADPILAGFAIDPCERLPARLIHDEQVLAEDYAILNPLGELDLIDRERSTVAIYDGVFEVETLDPWFISAARVPAGRDLFRVYGLPGYVFSDRLARFILDSGFSNLRFSPVEVA
jgi:hypothetical protein